MRRTAYRDRIGPVHVRLVLWRWHGIPVLAMMELGKLEARRPPWHVVAAMIAFELVSLAGAWPASWQVPWHGWL